MIAMSRTARVTKLTRPGREPPPRELAGSGRSRARPGVGPETEPPKPRREIEGRGASGDEEAKADRIETPCDHLGGHGDGDTDRYGAREGDAQPSGIHVDRKASRVHERPVQGHEVVDAHEPEGEGRKR